VNSFGLGESGRYRTNVWDYAGINSFGASRDTDLAMHPTVKPVALVADAIRDCSKRGDIVLDGFGGSGTTLIAAEQVGRRARLLEFDPAYCDTIVRRWERLTGKHATLEATGERFEDVEEERLAGVEAEEFDLDNDTSHERATELASENGAPTNGEIAE
jgi:DNA modification methylase